LDRSAAIDDVISDSSEKGPEHDTGSRQTAALRMVAEADAGVDPVGNAAISTGVAHKADDEVPDDSGLQNPIIRDNLAGEIEIAGVWAGFESFFWVTGVIVERDFESPDVLHITFEKNTDLGDAEYERIASFENGIVTLDEPVSRIELKGSRAPYTVLYAVHTDRGDFLVPSVNAATIKSSADLRPGTAYRRRAAP
jgi:hypothetical protein